MRRDPAHQTCGGISLHGLVHPHGSCTNHCPSNYLSALFLTETEVAYKPWSELLQELTFAITFVLPFRAVLVAPSFFKLIGRHSGYIQREVVSSYRLLSVSFVCRLIESKSRLGMPNLPRLRWQIIQCKIWHHFQRRRQHQIPGCCLMLRESQCCWKWTSMPSCIMQKKLRTRDPYHLPTAGHYLLLALPGTHLLRATRKYS